jgi:hypothetical protein
MQHFTAHRLTVQATAREAVLLNEHKGSALRGALYHGLRNRFCAMLAQGLACADCMLAAACPVCTLVSTLGPDNRLGRDAARPYTIQPPLDGRTCYCPGDALAFGLTLYAGAIRLFPYVIMALKELEEAGLGRRAQENGWRRGTLAVEAIWAENPLTGERAPVLQEGEALVRVADIPITHERVLAEAELLAQSERLRLSFLTPTRLTHRGRLVKPGQVRLDVIMGRVLDRLESLAQHFTDTPLALDYPALIRQAAEARVLADRTRWVELESYSTRQRRATPIGGLVGRVTLACQDWRPLMPWLVWGQFTHVGKDAVKGDGWYRLEAEG